DCRSVPFANRQRFSPARGARMKVPTADKRVELLFEVGCEEIPAGMLPKAEEELRTNVEKLLTAESLADGVSVETFSAPRRLTTWVRGLRAKQPDVETEVTGPPKSVAYDSVGAPTRAAQSFAEKQRVHVSDLYLVQTPKGEYLAAKQVKLGMTAQQNGVIIRSAKRQEKIAAELEAHAKKGSYRIHEDATLRKLVAYLNEYPTVIQGNFDPAFLSLPDEILVTVMRDHQKYFAVEKKNGQLGPHFLAVINVDKDSKGLIRAGHERVLRARFADAQFFWQSDQKCRLADYLPKLERVTYESRLGSYRDK